MSKTKRMKFPYGISSASAFRWECFRRISAVQERRGPDVGAAALIRLVDAELAAIERATAEHERREAEAARE